MQAEVTIPDYHGIDEEKKILYVNRLFTLKKIHLTGIFIIIASFLAFGIEKPGNPDFGNLYQQCGLEGVLSFGIFRSAITGIEKINGIKNKKIITLIDFSKSSKDERFYVIDLENKKLVYHTLVAHGKNSGEDLPKSFSNEPGSLKSSLGFFLTAETYYGKHGYSLRLDGLEPAINNNARKRDIVIHGAAYVSREIASLYGQLGRSWGCPALPVSLSKEIIDLISGGTCLFIYGEDPDYFKKSEILQSGQISNEPGNH